MIKNLATQLNESTHILCNDWVAEGFGVARRSLREYFYLYASQKKMWVVFDNGEERVTLQESEENWAVDYTELPIELQKMFAFNWG